MILQLKNKAIIQWYILLFASTLLILPLFFLKSELPAWRIFFRLFIPVWLIAFSVYKLYQIHRTKRTNFTA